MQYIIINIQVNVLDALNFLFLPISGDSYLHTLLKLSDERGFILAQRMDGWLFKNKPKMDFLDARHWVLGLTVKLLSSKIIKSYLLFTDQNWKTYVAILRNTTYVKGFLKSRLQKASRILPVRIKFWCYKVHWICASNSARWEISLKREHGGEEENPLTGNQGQNKRGAKIESGKNFLRYQNWGTFSKVAVTQYNSQKWSWVASFLPSFLHLLIYSFVGYIHQ